MQNISYGIPMAELNIYLTVNSNSRVDWYDYFEKKIDSIMMTLSNGNIFRVTGPLCGEFTGHRWIPLTKASDTELWWGFLSVHE